MKKRVFISIIIFVIFLLLIIFFSSNKKDKLSFNSQECKSNIDCTKNISLNDFNDTAGMPLPPPPCFKRKCGYPVSVKGWIEYCDNKKEIHDYNNLTWNCYINVAYESLNKSSLFDDYTIEWEKAFNICDTYVKDNSEKCKLDVCDNLYIGDGGMKHNYQEKSDCIKEAIKNSSCFDGVPNGRETDIDCGGSDCKPCEVSKNCKNNTDCQTQACNSGGFHRDYKCVEKCPNGKILDNEPCFCSKSMHYKDTLEIWQKEYGHLRNFQPSYCCNDTIQWEPCE